MDIKNAQPLFLGLIAAEGSIFQHSKSTQTTTNNNNTAPPNPICCIKLPEWRAYMAACSAGNIYELLLELCRSLTLFDILPANYRHPYGKNRQLNRNDVKRQFLTAIFAKNELMKQMPVWRVFAANFPTIASFVEEVKKLEYQKMARDCQRFESRVMIDSIAGELADSIGIVTVHDSILCAVENADIVESKIKAKFNKLGVDVAIGRSRPGSYEWRRNAKLDFGNVPSNDNVHRIQGV